MDEILLHISQRLEDLQVCFMEGFSIIIIVMKYLNLSIICLCCQVLIHSSLQSSRASFQSYSEQIGALSLKSKDVLKNCIQQINNAAALTSRSNVGSYMDSTWARINPYIRDVQEKLWLIIQWLREIFNQVWDVLQQQTSYLRTARAEGATG
jgi:hypothetical protein